MDDGQIGVAAQDPLLELNKLRSWFCALLLDQAAAGLRVNSESVRHPAREIERFDLAAYCPFIYQQELRLPDSSRCCVA